AHVRWSLRRQQLPVYLARADILRPGARPWWRLAVRGAGRRSGTLPPAVVFERLAVSPARFAGARIGAAGHRQGRRAPPDTGQLWPRLVPARGGAASADHRALSGGCVRPCLISLAPSGSIPAPSTPGSGPTRTPAPARCPSSRPPATSSKTRS